MGRGCYFSTGAQARLGGGGRRPCATFLPEECGSVSRGAGWFLGTGDVGPPPSVGRGLGARGPHSGAQGGDGWAGSLYATHQPPLGTGEAPPQAGVGALGVGLWPSTWWVHVHVALGYGATVLHEISAYGVVGDRHSNTSPWEDVHQLSGLGNTPHIVGVDCNFPRGRLRDVPQAMLAHLVTGRLEDLDLE